MQERKDLSWPKPLKALDEFCSSYLRSTLIEGFVQKVSVYHLKGNGAGGPVFYPKYVALLQETKGSVPSQKLFQSWKQSLQDMGNGRDFFSAAMLSLGAEHPKSLTAIYIKNQGELDWEAIERELELPNELRWGQHIDIQSGNWLAFYDQKISGITEPWLYIGPGYAGMHQEDGVMNSYNISVPVSVLPMTDEILTKHGIDFLKATKVWQFSPSTIREEDLLALRKCVGFSNCNTRSLSDQCSWRQLWGRDLILDTDTRWAQSAGHAILTRGQIHSTLSSGGINLAWNKACGPHWPARARAYDKKMHDAIGKDNADLALQRFDVPITFPTDTIIHQAAMVFIERGRAGVHEDIVSGLRETWLPWVQEDLTIIQHSASVTQVSEVDLGVRCSRCWRQTIYLYSKSDDGEFCWPCINAYSKEKYSAVSGDESAASIKRVVFERTLRSKLALSSSELL